MSEKDQIIALSNLQHGKKQITVLERVGAFLAVIAILMAGSEGPYFPWPNIIGTAIAVTIGILAAGRD